MSDAQLLALLTAVLLIDKSISSDDQVRQAAMFARVILKETAQ